MTKTEYYRKKCVYWIEGGYTFTSDANLDLINSRQHFVDTIFEMALDYARLHKETHDRIVFLHQKIDDLECELNHAWEVARGGFD